MTDDLLAQIADLKKENARLAALADLLDRIIDDQDERIERLEATLTTLVLFIEVQSDGEVMQ